MQCDFPQLRINVVPGADQQDDPGASDDGGGRYNRC